MVIDPTTPIGKIRLRVGDFSDLPLFDDTVYQSALDDCQGNLPRTSVLMCQYILASLTGQTHMRLVQLEVYGSDYFSQYLQFVKATILNPNLMQLTPLPYTPVTMDEFGNKLEVPLIQFQKDWNKNYYFGTQDQWMHLTGELTPTFPGFDGINFF